MMFKGRHFQVPKSWLEFESLCQMLFGAEWNAELKKHGRSGSPQFGVDLFGHSQKHKGVAAVQCKKKDPNFGKPVSRQDILNEIQEAEKFEPALMHYAIATSTKRSAEIQRIVEEVNLDRVEAREFTVEIFFWDDIEDLLERHPSVAEYFTSGSEATSPERGFASSQQAISGQKGIPEELQSRKDDPIAASQLDRARDLLKKFEPNEALKVLEPLEQHEGHFKNDYTRFRMHTNFGGAYLQLQDYRTAAERFRKAFEFSESDKALANLAQAELIDGNKESAKKILESAVKGGEIPEALIPIYLHITPIAELQKNTKRIDQIKEDSSFSRALAQRYIESDDTDAARKVLEDALKNTTAGIQRALLLVDLAHLRLFPLLKAVMTEHGGSPTVSQAKELKELSEMLGKAKSMLPKSSFFDERQIATTNRATTERILRNFDVAESLLEESMDIQFDPTTLKNLVILSLETNNEKKALELFDTHERTLKEKSEADWLDLLSMLLTIPDSLEDQEKRIKQLTKDVSVHDLIKFVTAYIANSKQSLDDSDIDTTIRKRLDVESPEAVSWVEFAIDIRKGVAIEEMRLPDKETEVSLSAWPIAKFCIQCLLARDANRIAADYLESFYRIAPTPEIFSMLIEAFAAANLFSKARDLIDTVEPEEVDPRTGLIIVDTFFHIGNLDQALSWLEALSENHTFDPLLIVDRKVRIALRKGEVEDAKRFSEGLSERGPKNFKELEAIARILAGVGRHRDALSLLLEERGKYSGNPKYHALYFVIRLSNTDEKVRPKKVTKGVAVNIRDGKGEEKLLLIGSAPGLEEYALDPSSDLAKQLTGRSKGDCIAFDNASQEFEIVDVLGIEDLAAIDSRKRVAQGSWDETHIASFDFKDFMDSEGNLTFPNPMHEQLDARRRQVEKLRKLLDDRSITFQIFAEQLQVGVFDVVMYLIGRGEGYPNTPSRGNSSADINNAKTLVFSLSSIAALFAIGALDDVIRGCLAAGIEVHIPRNVIDQIQSKLREHENTPGTPAGSAAMTDQGVVFEEYSEEQVEQHYRDIAAAIELLNKETTVISTAVDAAEGSTEKSLLEYLGLDLYGGAIAATNLGAILVVDDEVSSGLLSHETNVAMISSYQIVRRLYEGGHVDNAKYKQIAFNMVERNFDAHDVNADVMDECLREGLLRGDLYLTRILKKTRVLLETNRPVVINIISGFLVELWRGRDSKRFKVLYTKTVLDSIFSPSARKSDIQEITQRVKEAMYLEPITQKALLDVFANAAQDWIWIE